MLPHYSLKCDLRAGPLAQHTRFPYIQAGCLTTPFPSVYMASYISQCTKTPPVIQAPLLTPSYPFLTPSFPFIPFPSPSFPFIPPHSPFKMCTEPTYSLEKRHRNFPSECAQTLLNPPSEGVCRCPLKPYRMCVKIPLQKV